MKYKFTGNFLKLSIIIILLLIIHSEYCQSQSTKRVGITTLSCGEQVNVNSGKLVSLYLFEQLISSGKYQVINCGDLFKKSDFNSKNIMTKDIRQEGIQRGFQKLITGNISKKENGFELTLKVFDLLLQIDRTIVRTFSKIEDSKDASKSLLIELMNFLDGDKYLLFISTNPPDAKIDLPDAPSFTNGMELFPGDYKISVSRKGYKTEVEWLPLLKGLVVNSEMKVEFDLRKCPEYCNEVKTVHGIDFVYIPSGEFIMGSISGDHEELPEHRVIITHGFWMGKCEITQDQFQTVMDSNPSFFKGDRNLPVDRVSWDSASEFIKKLNNLGKEKFRLPTEAEWEYACRVGKETEFGFGEEGLRLRDYGWYINNSNLKTHPVGQKRPNPWGLHDMHGNLWEWCEDFYSENYYSISPFEDPKGPDGGTQKVIKGGCYFNNRDYCRSSTRGNNNPKYAYQFIGFRILMED